MNTKWMKTRLAALLICALAAQNASFVWADTRGTADRAGGETDAAGSAAGQAAETALESGNTSFVSFPSCFSDMLPDGFEEQYYCFALEGTADISISVESDDSSCQYGAELLDSGFASLGLSQRKSGQRMIQRDLPAGTYFLRVFPLSENTWEPYSVSLQKLKLSAEEVRKTDFSELHMVAALQGDDSPYQMNGMNPDYGFTGDGSVSPVNYQWYRLESPVYSGRGVNGGGVYPMPQSYYSAWLGPVAEDVIPISEVKGYTEGSLEDYEKYLQEEAIAYREGTPLIHVQNAIALPMKYTGYYEDGEGIENPGWEAHIKAGIMNYGALTTGIYWSYLSGDEEKNYYYSGWDYTYVSDSDGGAGNSGKDRPVHGSWVQAADGSWNFSAGGSTYQNTWGYLYNPYGAAGAGEAGWFRFDAAGRLLTGWFQDEDGSWYYLNPISDGSLGKMATGWRWIPDASGREYCYYFHPNAGGPMGAMAASGKTPDGYEVDAQGRWCADGTPQTR